MILNAYAILDLFLSSLRLLLGVGVIVLGVSTWRQCDRAAAEGEQRDFLEDRGYLLSLLACLLLVVNLISWPLFYLLLQSYVAEWPGVMCIYGVTQIGVGSLGPSRFLPSLLRALQMAKPALVFVSGAWFVLYLANRQTRTAPLRARLLGTLVLVGVLGIGDAGAELAYLIIPKKEVFYTGGCCTAVFDGEARASRFVPQALFGEEEIPTLSLIWIGVTLVQMFAVGLVRRFSLRTVSRGVLTALTLGALVCLTVNSVFLVEVAAPRLLHLPFHHCPYDLVPLVPESMVAVALLFGGTFSVGWATVVAWFGNTPETRSHLPRLISALLTLGAVGYFGSVVMMSLELLLA